MKKLIFITCLLFANHAGAYDIGGAYASLIKCEYGRWGYQYGNIGTYHANGDIFQVFFGNNYCQH